MHGRYKTATACIKPYSIPLAKEVLAGSGVLVCPVIGFPHGNSTTTVKVFEATEAVKAVRSSSLIFGCFETGND